MIVLDTNVVSELMRTDPEPAVIAWLNRQAVGSIWLTAITIIEVRYGILILPMGRRREGMMKRFDGIAKVLLDNRILPFDGEAAVQSADIAARRRLSGRNIASGGTQIAGIVASRRAMLATRNRRDFEDLEIALVDPWNAP